MNMKGLFINIKEMAILQALRGFFKDECDINIATLFSLTITR